MHHRLSTHSPLGPAGLHPHVTPYASGLQRRDGIVAMVVCEPWKQRPSWLPRPRGHPLVGKRGCH